MVDEQVATLLREAGLSAFYQLTPVLFMDEAERPSPEDLDACGKGITIRNHIMHSSSKRGKYKIRNATNKDINQAYGAVLRVYGSYVAAIEKRLNP